MKGESLEILLILIESGVGRKNIFLSFDETGNFTGKISGKQKRLLREKLKSKKVDQYRRVGIEVVTYWDKSYPIWLRQIADPPVCLFVKGKLKKDSSKVAMVGSRQMSRRGELGVEKIIPDLVKAGLQIVSGLALGVDAKVHQTTLKNGGTTLAVLPCGLDEIYPKRHQQLAEEIVKTGGGLVSEYPFGRRLEKKNFLERNRIVSGLSLGVVVIEAAGRSGSISSPNFALDQGREVWCLRASRGEANSEGVLGLIEDGAREVETGKDVLKDLGF